MATNKTPDGPLNLLPPKEAVVRVKIVGTCALLINAFPRTTLEGMIHDQSAPKTDKKSKSARPPRDFDQEYENARHTSAEGWDGIHATGFKHAMGDAALLMGLQKAPTKRAIWIVPDGFDAKSGDPLVRILGATPEVDTRIVRTKTQSRDPMPRVRPSYENWGAEVLVRYDPAVFTAQTIVTLLHVAGYSTGIGDARTMGLGRFCVVNK